MMARMIRYMIETFSPTLEDIELYRANKNVLLGIPHNSYHLFNILEMYNPNSRTFFSPIDKLGFALQKMFEVSLLFLRELRMKSMCPPCRS